MQVLCRPELQPRGIGRSVPTSQLAGQSGSCLRVGGLPLDARGISPQALQAVEVPGGGLEHMDNDIAVVQENPLGLPFALFTKGTPPEGTELLLDVFGEALHMGTGGPGDDDEDVGDGDEIADTEEHDVHPVLVGEGVGGCSCQVGGVQIGGVDVRVDERFLLVGLGSDDYTDGTSTGRVRPRSCLWTAPKSYR